MDDRNEQEDALEIETESKTETLESDLKTKAEESTSLESDAKPNVSGGNVAMFDESNAEDVKLMQASRDIVNKNIVNNYYDKNATLKHLKISCPKCHEEIEIKKYGKQTCPNPNCKYTFERRNRDLEKDIVIYKTLLTEEVKKYEKILARVNNSLEEANYEEAYELCKKAEEIAPGEAATWVYFALVEFLVGIKRKDGKGRKPATEIIKKVKSHIEKCKIHGMTKEECRPLIEDIANRLFEIEKSRINSVQAQYRDNHNNPLWSYYNFSYLNTLLESFEICYSLYKNVDFLEAYVDELKKDYKWIYKKVNGELISNPECVKFSPVKKLLFLLSKIQTIKPDYRIPAIAEERFVINKRSYLKINTSLQK